jgi:hypothetical protein
MRVSRQSNDLLIVADNDAEAAELNELFGVTAGPVAGAQVSNAAVGASSTCRSLLIHGRSASGRKMTVGPLSSLTRVTSPEDTKAAFRAVDEACDLRGD